MVLIYDYKFSVCDSQFLHKYAIKNKKLLTLLLVVSYVFFLQPSQF